MINLTSQVALLLGAAFLFMNIFLDPSELFVVFTTVSLVTASLLILAKMIEGKDDN